MDLPFVNQVNTIEVYNQTIDNIKSRLPRCPNATIDLFDRVNGIINKIKTFKDKPIDQIKIIEDNLPYLSWLNYQLKRLVA
nr:MAG TPA: divalent ion tolerance protein [Caudoviricetes sp.]